MLELSVGNELCLALGESVQIYAADAIVPIILLWYFSRLIDTACLLATSNLYAFVALVHSLSLSLSLFLVL